MRRWARDVEDTLGMRAHEAGNGQLVENLSGRR